MPLTIIKSSGGGTGSDFAGTNPPIYITSNTISANYTFSAGTGGVSVGPLVLANGVSIIIPAGSKWVVL